MKARTAPTVALMIMGPSTVDLGREKGVDDPHRARPARLLGCGDAVAEPGEGRALEDDGVFDI
jgi:hypothetical protein